MYWLKQLLLIPCLWHDSWAASNGLRRLREDTELLSVPAVEHADIWKPDLDDSGAFFDRLTLEMFSLSHSMSLSFVPPTPTPGAGEPSPTVPSTPSPETPSPTATNQGDRESDQNSLPTVLPEDPQHTSSPLGDELIEAKCGMSAQDRSTLLLTVLSSISSTDLLTDPSSSRYAARYWLENIDGAVLCPLDVNRVLQRYTAALLYFQMDGNSWSNCQADLPSSTNLGECVNPLLDTKFADQNFDLPEATRFLDASNECMWFGLACDGASDTITADEFSPITLIRLSTNGLKGDLPVEIFGWTKLRSLIMDGNKLISGPLPHQVGQLTVLEYLDLDDNIMEGNLPEELFGLTSLLALDLNNNQFVGSLSASIGNLVNLRALQLENNNFNGAVPTASLLLLEDLVSLYLDGNDFTGSLEPICEVVDDTRDDFSLYLRLFTADCGGDNPEVECSCCQC